ncbi:MAG: hypothetical protein ABL912_11595, partial [Novosphingobium sp.]
WGAGVKVAGIEVTGANYPAKLAETSKLIDKANEEARKDHEISAAYANDRRQKAEAEATAFDKAYALYKAAPDVTRSRIYYETIEKVLRNNQVVLGGSGGITLPSPLAPKAASGQQEGR